MIALCGHPCLEEIAFSQLGIISVYTTPKSEDAKDKGMPECTAASFSFGSF
jgi:hypothetical protein